jgi:hypothetical protein
LRRLAAGVAIAGLVALASWGMLSKPTQRIVLPSGYTITLQEVFFPPFNAHVFGGPWWHRWLVRLPMNRIPVSWVRAQTEAQRNSQRLGSTNGIALWESLTPPKTGPLPGGREAIHHQILPEHGYFPNEPMSGGGGIDFVTCWADTFPRSAKAFRIQVFALERDHVGQLLGEFTVRNPRPMVSAGWAGAPLPLTKTQGGVSCELISLETAEAAPSERLKYPGMLQLRIRDQGVVTTNWTASALRVLDSTGNRVDHVDNLGFTNGTLRAGFYPLWPGDDAWRIEVDLARTAAFPPENQWSLTVPFQPEAPLTNRVAAETFGGTSFRALLATPGMLEFPDGRSDAIASAQLRVEALQPPAGFSLRLVDLHDQAGRPVAWKRSQWGGGFFRWILAEPKLLENGTVTGVTARFSWEPTLTFTYLARPTSTTRYADWPRRASRTNDSPMDWIRMP